MAQIAKRLGEKIQVDRQQDPKKEKFPNLKNVDIDKRSRIVQFENFILNSSRFKDKWFLTVKNEIVSMTYALLDNNIMTIYGCPVAKTELFYQPIKSSYLNIYKSDGILGSLSEYSIGDVKCKFAVVVDDNELVFIPLLHTYILYFLKNK